MRGRRIALGATVFALALAAPRDAIAKGSLAAWDSRYFVPGDVASGRLHPRRPGGLDDLADGRRAVYLIPWQQWRRPRPPLLRTIPVEDERVFLGRRLAHVRFTIPAASAGAYKVAICSTSGPCNGRTIASFEGDRITIVGPRTAIPLWREIDRLRAQLSAVRSELNDIRYVVYRQPWRQIFQYRLAQLQVDVDALGERLERPPAEAASDASRAAMPTIAASSALGLLVGGLVATRRAAFRRHVTRGRRGGSARKPA